MRDVKYAANNVAFTQDEEGNLWRVDVDTGQWEELISAGDNVSGYYGIARDGFYAFVLQDQEMWRIPAEMGTAVEQLPNVKMTLDVLGSGRTIPPLRQLGNTSFWLISLPFVLKGNVLSEDSIFGGIIVNTQDGTVLAAEEIGLSPEHYLTNLHLSSDGEWLSISLTDGESRQIAGLYLTPADDLASGQLINSSGLSVVGWHTNPPAVIFRDEAAGTLSVATFPLADESTGVPLEGAGEWPRIMPGSIITTAADNPARILQFDLEGNLVNTLDLSAQYESVQVAQGAAERVYLATVGRQSQENNACTYGLIEWTPGS